jgi:hypothetical protein
MDQATPAPRVGRADVQVRRPPSKSLKPDPPLIALNDATADFNIMCEDATLKAHQAVLVAASAYFERMLRFGGKVSTHSRCFTTEFTNTSIRSKQSRKP